MRISLTRAVAGTAIAATAALTMAGTASASTSYPVKAPTALSIVESRTHITVGQKDVISGDLKTGKTPLAGKVVYLERVSGRKLIPVQADLTGKYGWAGFVVKPNVTARYELVFRGTPKFAATHSGVVTVVVKPKPPVKAPTSLSIAESASSITAGQTDVISGDLMTGTKPVVKRVVWLYRFGVKANKWLPVEVRLTGTAGKTAFTVKPGTTTTYELVFFGTQYLAGTHSSAVTVTVTQ